MASATDIQHLWRGRSLNLPRPCYEMLFVAECVNQKDSAVQSSRWHKPSRMKIIVPRNRKGVVGETTASWQYDTSMAIARRWTCMLE